MSKRRTTRNVVKQRLKRLSFKEYSTLREFSIAANRLRNLAIQHIEDYYEETGEFLQYVNLYHTTKKTSEYRGLNSNMAQQILKNVNANYASFFELLKLKKEGKYDKKVSKPKQKRKLSVFYIQQIQIKDGKLLVPMSREQKKKLSPIYINIPPHIQPEEIAYIQIIPKSGSFTVHYITKKRETPEKVAPTKAMGIDFGVKNLMTLATSTGETLIIDGKQYLSRLSHFNYTLQHIQMMKDKQHHHHKTKRQKALEIKRENYMVDYAHKAVARVMTFVKKHQVSKIICGYHTEFQQNVNLGRKNNGVFSRYPFGLLRRYLKEACDREGIHYSEQEESYTSKASFFDDDTIPVFNKKTRNIPHTFSGKRVSRGLYRSQSGYLFNADVNGALNILTKGLRNNKAVVHQLKDLRRKGVVNTPVRIRVA